MLFYKLMGLIVLRIKNYEIQNSKRQQYQCNWEDGGLRFCHLSDYGVDSILRKGLVTVPGFPRFLSTHALIRPLLLNDLITLHIFLIDKYSLMILQFVWKVKKPSSQSRFKMLVFFFSKKQNKKKRCIQNFWLVRYSLE